MTMMMKVYDDDDDGDDDMSDIQKNCTSLNTTYTYYTVYSSCWYNV